MGELRKVALSVQEVAERQHQDTLNALLKLEPKAQTSADRIAQTARCQRAAEDVVRENVVVPHPGWARQTREGYTDENTADWSEEPLLPKPRDVEHRGD